MENAFHPQMGESLIMVGRGMHFYMCNAIASVYPCYHTFIEDTVGIKISKRPLRAVSNK